MSFSCKVAALPAVAFALVLGVASAPATAYDFRVFVPGLKVAQASQPPGSPAPPSGPTRVGDGVSRVGACATTGSAGCAS